MILTHILILHFFLTSSLHNRFFLSCLGILHGHLTENNKLHYILAFCSFTLSSFYLKCNSSCFLALCVIACMSVCVCFLSQCLYLCDCLNVFLFITVCLSVNVLWTICPCFFSVHLKWFCIFFSRDVCIIFFFAFYLNSSFPPPFFRFPVEQNCFIFPFLCRR